ncbi:MAG: corrinoid protein [Dehalococcoidia bacterium]|jgi:5-methyltetrahydrofolate--homocysteine methyltransferase|nr:corrinoid protein [Dehalococcoidia bacterium]
MELTEVQEYVIEGNAKGSEQWTKDALAEGMDPAVIVNEGLIPAMDVVGEKFKNEEYYMPDMLVSARAMKAAMSLVKPLIAEAGGSSKGTVIVGTVQGDLHDIGKNLVSMMLEGAGFDVVDLGTDVAPETFVTAVEEHDANLLGLSALLTTTMPMIGETIGALNESEIRSRIKIMIGGAPVTAAYATSVGADGFAEDAATAVEVAKELVGA